MQETKTDFRYYLSALLLGIMIAGSISFFSSSLIYSFTNDSSGYIETAENWANGEGFKQSTDALNPIPYQPLGAHPPGYSTSIAGLITLGVPVKTGALLLPFLGWVFLPGIILFVLAPAIGNRVALLIGALTATSPGLAEIGLIALPDVFFMTLVIITIALLLRGTNDPIKFRLIFFSGVIAGLGYIFRNTGLPLFAAIAASLLFAPLLGIFSSRMSARIAATWFAGAATVIIPLFVRNLIVFGSIQPYHSAIDYFGFLKSFRIYLWSLFYDLTGFRFAADLAWDFKLLIVVLVSCAALLVITAQFKSVLRNKHLLFTGSVLFFYLCAGSSMIIIVRAIYPLSELTLIRHAMQYTWTIPALIAILIIPRKTGTDKPIARFSIQAILVVFILGHISYIAQTLEKEKLIQKSIHTHESLSAAAAALPPKWVLTNQIKYSISKNSGLIDFVNTLPKGTLIASNFAKVLNIETNRAVRRLHLQDFPSTQELAKNLRDFIASKDSPRLFVWIIIPTNEMLKADYLFWITFDRELPKNLGTIFKTNDLWVLTNNKDVINDTTQLAN